MPKTETTKTDLRISKQVYTINLSCLNKSLDMACLSKDRTFIFRATVCANMAEKLMSTMATIRDTI